MNTQGESESSAPDNAPESTAEEIRRGIRRLYATDRLYREGLLTLADIGADAIRSLAEATAETFWLEAVDVDLGLDDRKMRSVLDVASILFEFRRALATEFQPLVEREVFAVLSEALPTIQPEIEDALGALLADRASNAANRERRAIQSAIFPTVKTSSWTVALRYSNKNEDATGYYPIVQARLRFDEPVAGGLADVSFQVTEEALDRLLVKIEQVRADLAQVRLDLGENIR